MQRSRGLRKFLSWTTVLPRSLAGITDPNYNNRRQPASTGVNRRQPKRKNTWIKKRSVIMRHLEASSLEATLDVETLIDFGAVKNAL